MHQTVREVDLIQKVSSPVDAHGITLLLHCPHDIGYHPLIAVKGESPLQHDGNSLGDITSKRIVDIQFNKIGISRAERPSTAALLTSFAGHLHMVAFLTPGHMVDHASGYIGK